MNRTVVANDGTVITLCSYRFTEPNGHTMQCRAPMKCPVCRQCSRIIEGKEHGHCPGHLGLMDDIIELVPDRGTV
jgi:hypothetical protein